MKFLLDYKIFESVQQAKSILKELKISEEDKDYQTIRNLFKGNEGYVGWFTKMRYKNNIPLTDLNNIVNLIKNYNQLIKALPKNLVQYDTYENLLDDIELTKTKLEVKKCYDEFPATQRKLLDINNTNIIQLLKTLYNVKNNSAYFSKVARYKNKQILIDSIKSFIEGNTKKADFNDITKKFQNYHKGELLPIILDKDHDLIIIRAISSSVVSTLGRGTSWCITDSSTFKEYVPDNRTSQYMIWLTDMPIWSNYSMIGVTIGPKGYITGHLKDDSYLTISSLIEILSQRGFDAKKLYPKLEKSYNYSIPELRMLFGISDDEILTAVLNGEKVLDYNSIRYFRKEDLDSKGIVVQFKILLFDDLLKMGYTKSDIMKNKTSFTSSELKHLTQDEIRKIGFDKFELKDLLKHFDIDELIKGKTSISDIDELNIIGVDNVMKYNLMLDDIRLPNLIKHDYSSKTYSLIIPFDYILTHKRKWNSSEFYYLTKDQAIEIINKYKVRNYFSVTFIDKTKFTKEEVLKYNNRLPDGFSPMYLGEVGLTIDECSENKINVVFNGQESYENYDLPKTKPNDLSYIDSDKKRKSEWIKVREFYDLLAGGTNSSYSSDDKGNRVRAFNLIKFYNFDLFDTIELCKQFNLKGYSEPEVTDVFDYLISKGLKTEVDILKIVDDMVSSSDRSKAKVEIVTHFKLDKLYPYILKIIEDSDSIDVEYLDSIPDSYQSQKDRIINSRKIKDINKNRAIRPWYSGMGSQRNRNLRDSDEYEISAKELSDIYKVFEEAKGIEWINDAWHDVDGSILVFFFALVKLNKLDEFKELNYEFNGKTMNKLLGHLCHSDISNGRTCVGILLNKEEELRAYNWLKNNLFKDYELFPMEEQVPIVYRFDKPYYEKLFKNLLETRAEYTYINRFDKRVEKDLKIHNFKKLIGYFAKSKDFNKETSVKSFKEFLKKFLSSIKLNKQQLKDTRTYLTSWSNYPFASNREDFFNCVKELMPEEPKKVK
jgi:hypothetical protein